MATSNFFDLLDKKVNNLTSLVLDLKNKPNPAPTIQASSHQKFGNAKNSAKRYVVYIQTLFVIGTSKAILKNIQWKDYRSIHLMRLIILSNLKQFEGNLSRFVVIDNILIKKMVPLPKEAENKQNTQFEWNGLTFSPCFDYKTGYVKSYQ